MLCDRRRQRQRQRRTLAIGLQRDPVQLRTGGMHRHGHSEGGNGQNQRCQQVSCGTAVHLETEIVVQTVVPSAAAPRECMLTADTFQYELARYAYKLNSDLAR
jgi:hypothetical protein